MSVQKVPCPNAQILTCEGMKPFKVLQWLQEQFRYEMIRKFQVSEFDQKIHEGPNAVDSQRQI